MGKGVDEQKDQLILMSKFSKNCVFSGLEIQREHCRRAEPVLNAHSSKCKIWPKGMQTFATRRSCATPLWSKYCISQERLDYAAKTEQATDLRCSQQQRCLPCPLQVSRETLFIHCCHLGTQLEVDSISSHSSATSVLGESHIGI